MIINSKQQQNIVGHQHIVSVATDYFAYLEHGGEAGTLSFRDAGVLKAFFRSQWSFLEPLCNAVCLVADGLSKREDQVIFALGFNGIVIKSHPDREERFEFAFDFLTQEAKAMFDEQKRLKTRLNGHQC